MRGNFFLWTFNICFAKLTCMAVSRGATFLENCWNFRIPLLGNETNIHAHFCTNRGAVHISFLRFFLLLQNRLFSHTTVCEPGWPWWVDEKLKGQTNWQEKADSQSNYIWKNNSTLYEFVFNITRSKVSRKVIRNVFKMFSRKQSCFSVIGNKPNDYPLNSTV